MALDMKYEIWNIYRLWNWKIRDGRIAQACIRVGDYLRRENIWKYRPQETLKKL